MHKLKLQHGYSLLEAEEVYGVKVTAIDKENECENYLVFALPGLDRLSKKKLDELMENISLCFNSLCEYDNDPHNYD